MWGLVDEALTERRRTNGLLEEMNMPTRLQRFIERGDGGETSGRVAYVLKPELLGPPQRNMQWKLYTSFNAAEEVLKEASLKDVYALALKHGLAIVTPRRDA